VTAILFAAYLAADEQPLLVHSTAIDYPYFAHTTGVQGTVKFELSIDQSGAVGSVKHVSGPAMLAAPTAGILKTWSFSRCTSGDCLFPLTIRFVLEGGPLYAQQCTTKVSFDGPNLVTVQTEHRRPYIN